jgi:hypothetical protein
MKEIFYTLSQYSIEDIFSINKLNSEAFWRYIAVSNTGFLDFVHNLVFQTEHNVLETRH